MAIIVNRFIVRHNGKAYGPGQAAGQIIEGLSEQEEASLIADSRGTIQKYPQQMNTVDEESDDVTGPDTKEPEDTGTSEVNMGINPEDISVETLIKMGAGHPEPDSEELSVLELILQPLTKKQLLIYANAAGLDVNDRMKNAEIIQIILDAAETNGIDLESMTSEQLLEFGLAFDVKTITAEMPREQLIDLISTHLEKMQNE